jgi:hypothetical protein
MSPTLFAAKYYNDMKPWWWLTTIVIAIIARWRKHVVMDSLTSSKFGMNEHVRTSSIESRQKLVRALNVPSTHITSHYITSKTALTALHCQELDEVLQYSGRVKRDKNIM